MLESGLDNQNATGTMTPDFPDSAYPEGDATDRARPAVAEARFALAMSSLRYLSSTPRYTGPPLRRSFDRWFAAVLEPWFDTQRFYLEQPISSQFQAVIATGVNSWQIAAAGQLAIAFEEFGWAARDFRGAVLSDVPPRDEWRANLNVEDPNPLFFDLARIGFEACMRRATDARTIGLQPLCAAHLRQLRPGDRQVDELAEILPGLVE